MKDTYKCIKFTILESYLHYLMITPRMTQFTDFSAIQGNISLHTEAILTKCKMHICVMVINIFSVSFIEFYTTVI